MIAAILIVLSAGPALPSTFNQKPFNKSPHILKFDKAEAQQRLDGVSLFSLPYETCVYGVGHTEAGEDGYIVVWDGVYLFVTDPGWDRIVYGKRGHSVIRCYGGYGECDDGTEILEQPTSIDIAPNGTEQSVYVFVADTGNNRIVVLLFDESTMRLSFVKELVDPAYPLDQPFGVSWDHAGTPLDFSNDYVWVADAGNHRIVKFHVASSTVVAVYDSFLDLSGNEVTMRYPQGLASFKQFGNEHGPYGTAGERLFVADTGRDRILRFKEEEGVLTLDDVQDLGYSFDANSAPGIVSPDPRFICVDVDAHGALYVPDAANSHIHKLKYHHERCYPEVDYPILPLEVYGSEGTGAPDQFLQPLSMSVMRARIQGTGGVVRWTSVDNVFTVEDWTENTGAQRHELSVEAEIVDVDVYPGLSVAEFYWLTTEYSFLTVEIVKPDGTPVKTIWPTGPEPDEADLRKGLWDGKNDSGQDCPQGDYVLRVTAEDWMTEEGQEYEVSVAEEAFAFPDPIPEVEVISPNGGEFWESGSSQEIAWNIPGAGPIGPICVYVYWNGGAEFQMLNCLAPDARSYTWDNVAIPEASAECYIEVKAYYEDNMNSKVDVSDSCFSICNSGAEPVNKTWTVPLRV